MARRLAQLLNEDGAENESNTPDFILADAMLGVLGVLDRAIQRRDRWYGVVHAPGRPVVGIQDKINRIVEDMALAAERGTMPYVHMIEAPAVTIRPEDIPPEILDLLDRAAGREHSRTGTVAGNLAEILTVWERLRVGVVGGGTAPAPAAIRPESVQDGSPVGGDTSNAPGGSQRVMAPGAETSGGWGWSGAQPDVHCPTTAAHAAHAWSWRQAPTDRKWCDGSAMVGGTTVVGSNVTIDRDEVEDDCPHCSPTHGSPNRCAWGVRVDTEVDGDGQPTRLIVQPTDGAHVAQADADWLWGLIRRG